MPHNGICNVKEWLWNGRECPKGDLSATDPMSTKKEKCCKKCHQKWFDDDGWNERCSNINCQCHSKSESIDLDEIDNKITDLVQHLPSEKRGEIWTLIHESRKQSITTAVAKRLNCKHKCDENCSNTKI